MDDEAISKYAIIARDLKVRLYQSPDILIKDSKVSENNNCEINVPVGSLVKIYQAETSSASDVYASDFNKLSIIEVLDYVNKVPIFQNLYECPRHILRPVRENFWPFVINIEPERRLRLIENIDQCKWLVCLKVNDFVIVSGEMFNMSNTKFHCIIRYIGPVLEFYPVGYFFGLEILDCNVCSPQADKVKFSKTLMNCEPKLSIITTANFIYKIPKEQEKKFSIFEFLSGTIKSVASNTNISLKEDKKPKKTKTPTAQFYRNTEETTESCVNNNMTMDRGKKVPSNFSPLESEEFKQSIENREKNLERRATTSNTVQTQTQSQSGILKKGHLNKTKSSENEPEIVRIDDDYIEESMRQESDVIVLQKEENIDLGDLVADIWLRENGNLTPNNAIRNINTNINTSTSNRNKSFNPLTHLACNSGKRTNDSVSTNIENFDGKKLQNADYGMLPAFANTEFNSLPEVPNTDLSLNSVVEVNVPELPKNLSGGVIRWIGKPPGQKNILIGVELDHDVIDKQFKTSDGGFEGARLFKCPSGRGIFVTSGQCSIDRRFLGATGGDAFNASCETNENKIKTLNGFHDDQQNFGHMECPVVPGAVAPIKCSSLESLEDLCGKYKGIQGNHNSCYLDVTLFSMFAFTPVFDAILYRPPDNADISDYAEVQKVLREEIVNPLRKHMYVRADRVMKLRQLLDKLSSVSGLMSEEKDPEEFLNCLLSQIMRAEPFLKLNSGQDAHYYQLFVEKDEHLSFPSVQQLFEQSFYASDIKLKEVPSCLIIQMPRFGKDFKMYPRILPSQVLDVTDIIDDSPRQCSVCGKLALFECRDCFGALQTGISLEGTSFCGKCLETVHMHVKRTNHSHRKLSVPQDFLVMAETVNVPRLYMELFAVVCIETSHYVTFVKTGSSPDAPWCFFNSMADRKGEINGYNIPEMKTVPELPQWLSDDGARTVNESYSSDKMLPEHAKRLFCDAYMCMYQSTDVMMYR